MSLDRLELMKRMAEEGLTHATIGRIVGLTRERVRQLLGNVSSAKLAEREARGREVTEAFRGGESLTSIALRHGVSAAAVTKWIVGTVGFDEYRKLRDRRRRVSRERSEARARGLVEEFLAKNPDGLITHTNLGRTLGIGAATYVDRVKPMRAWRKQYGQPRRLEHRRMGDDGITRIGR